MTAANVTRCVESASPVRDHENEEVGGPALCGVVPLEQKQERIRDLRQRHAENLASLPTTAKDCLSGALNALQPGGELYPEGFGEALYLSFALEPMIRHLQTDEPCIHRSAMVYVADRVCLGLMQAARKIEQANAILRNPARIERETRHGLA